LCKRLRNGFWMISTALYGNFGLRRASGFGFGGP